MRDEAGLDPLVDPELARSIGPLKEITDVGAEAIAMAALERFTKLLPHDQPAAFNLLQMVAGVCEEMAGENDSLANLIFNIAYYLAWRIARRRQVRGDHLVQIFEENLINILNRSRSLQEGKAAVDNLLRA